MEKIPVSSIVAFRRKSAAGQQTLINNLRTRKKEEKDEESSGGHYWITSLSSISSAFKLEENTPIKDKIEVAIEKMEAANAKITKDMFQRNINILYNFEDFDFSKWKPNTKLTYLKRPKIKSIIEVKGLPIQVLPNHVFTFEADSTDKIGAVWFVAKLGGYQENELAMFTDMLYRYLNINYAEKYQIAPEFCRSVDVTDVKDVNHAQIINGDIPILLESTLDSIKAMMK